MFVNNIKILNLMIKNFSKNLNFYDYYFYFNSYIVFFEFDCNFFEYLLINNRFQDFLQFRYFEILVTSVKKNDFYDFLF